LAVIVTKRKGMDMVKKYLESIATRKGTRLLALYYLTRRLNEYVQLQELANAIGCHPRSVSLALDPLTKDPLWASELEKRKIGTAVIYRLKNGKSSMLLKKFFDSIVKEYGNDEG